MRTWPQFEDVAPEEESRARCPRVDAMQDWWSTGRELLPTPLARRLNTGDDRTASEFVVHTDASDVIAHASGQREGAESRLGYRVGDVAEIDVKILGLGTPIAAERGLDAAADCPAGLGAVELRCLVQGRTLLVDGGLDLTECTTACDVEQRGSGGIAQPSAGRCEPR